MKKIFKNHFKVKKNSRTYFSGYLKSAIAAAHFLAFRYFKIGWLEFILDFFQKTDLYDYNVPLLVCYVN